MTRKLSAILVVAAALLALPAHTSAQPESAPAQPSQSASAPAPAEADSTPVNSNDALPLGRPSKAGANLSNQSKSSSGYRIVETFSALAVVVGLALVARHLVGKYTGRTGGAASQSPAVQVLTRVAVAPRNHVLLIRLGQRVMVLGDSPNGLRTLGQITDPDEMGVVLASLAADRPNSITRGFNQLLSRLQNEYPDDETAAPAAEPRPAAQGK